MCSRPSTDRSLAVCIVGVASLMCIDQPLDRSELSPPALLVLVMAREESRGSTINRLSLWETEACPLFPSTMDDTISSSRGTVGMGQGIGHLRCPIPLLLAFFTRELSLSIVTITLARLCPSTVGFLYVLSLRLPLLDIFSSSKSPLSLPLTPSLCLV